MTGFGKMSSKWKKAGCLILITILAELFLFNIRSVQSLFYQEQELTADHMRLDGFDTVDVNGTTVYVLADGYDNGVVYLTGLDQLTEQVHNVYLEWYLPLAQDVPYERSGICTITPMVRDEGHDQYTQLADHIYRPDIGASKYLWLQGNGKIRTVVLQTAFSEQGALQIGRIVVNAHRPVQFSLIRCITVFLLLLVVFGLKEATWDTAEEYGQNNRRGTAIAAAVGMVLLFPAVVLNNANDYEKMDRHFQPYQLQAEAFAAGQAHLLIEPTDSIKTMENPYDYTARIALGLEEGVDYLWDTAYYNGHYYTYFGVIPCLLLYFPVWMITHVHLTEVVVVILCAAFFYAGVWALICQLCRIFYKKIPFVLQLMAAVTIFLGSDMMACLGNPDAHDVPRLCGITFLVWGLDLWLASIRENGKEALSLGRLAAGSFCMALSVGCRPNLALYSFVAPVLFWQYRRMQKSEKEQGLWKRYAALLGPYVPVAIGLMYYNQIRFGSPFDFGFAYNLTMQDCSRTVLSLDKVVLGIFGYLLKMPQMDYRFPYLLSGDFAELNRIGHTTVYVTYCYGGLLVCNLVTWCIPVVFTRAGRRERGSLLALAVLAIVALQVLVNALTGGVSYNYMADFAFPLIMAGWMSAFLCWEKLAGSDGVKLLRGFLILNLVWSFWFHINFYFASTLDVGNTELYYRIAYAFNFF